MDKQLNNDDELDTCNFLNRLRSLQRLCSNNDARYPSGLLFIVGPDGRYNKGSLNIVKYLFQGATGKYLLEGSLDDNYEPLEELVLLIQQTSVSVIWSNAAKAIIGPLLAKVPLLVEYIPTIGEEEVVDLFQARKCIDFKRMLLEAVPAGRGIGITVPLGYDELQEVETWPMLQAFAIDDVFCSTGFFTARYEVVDMTEYIDVLFKSVDGFVVDKAIDILRSSILPHVQQTVGILDTSTADQRSRLTAEDVAGPLEMLFEFGELECAYPVDPLMRPVVYFGLDSSAVGASATAPEGWRSRTVGKKSLIAISEACEPSTGMRWCRTYFLHRGKSLRPVSVDGDDTLQETPKLSPDIVKCVERLEGIYGKLLIGLRAAVKAAFSVHTDVLEAGTFVQQAMGTFMKGKQLPGIEISAEELVAVDDFELLPGERLKLHMDCLNAHGQIVTIDDVDDMGGSCWTYIRVSVHGIPYINGQTLAVAVGDTFLFSSYSGQLNVRQSKVHSIAQKTNATVRQLPTLAPLFADCFCITHTIPYFRRFSGPGIEDVSSQLLLAATRSPHMLLSLGLGKLLDTTASGNLSFPLITDHPLMPFAAAEFKAYSEGLLIEKLDTKCLPVLISMNSHVERMWVIDAEECLAQAIQMLKDRDVDMPDFVAPNGNIVVFRLKIFDEGTENADQSSHVNPLLVAVPGLSRREPHHIAFFISTSTRMAPSMNSACASWRNVLKANDIQVHRGGDVSIPHGILISFLALVDHWSHHKDVIVLEETSFKAASVVVRVAEEMGSGDLTSNRHVGLGFAPIRCVHALSEAKRTGPNPAANSGPADVQEAAERIQQLSLQGAGNGSGATTDAVIISGLPGSGTLAIGAQIYSRLQKSTQLLSQPVALSFHLIDVSSLSLKQQFDEGEIKSTILRSCQRSPIGDRDSIAVVVVLHAPCHHVKNADLISFIAVALNAAHIAQLITVVSAASLFPLTEDASRGCGFELWRATELELCQPSTCDLALFVEHSANSPMYGVFKDWLVGAHPSLNTVKMLCNNLRLDDDIFDSIVSQLTVVKLKQGDRREGTPAGKRAKATANRLMQDDPVFLLRGLASARQQSTTSDFQFALRHSNGPHEILGKGLASFQLISPPGEHLWSLNSLTSTLRLLFPHATPPNTPTEATWRPSERPGGQSFWSRLTHLAKIKVMTERQSAAGSKQLKENIDRVLASDALGLRRVNAGLISVHAIIRVRSGHPLSSSGDLKHSALKDRFNFYSVEANHSCVLIRHVEDRNTVASGYPVDVLIVHGSLAPKEQSLAAHLLQTCVEQKLLPAPSLTHSDVSYETTLEIQSKNQHVPLPGDIWFDGQAYVDIKGNRKALRPDIDVLVGEYLRRKNDEIEKYNKLLNEVQEYL